MGKTKASHALHGSFLKLAREYFLPAKHVTTIRLDVDDLCAANEPPQSCFDRYFKEDDEIVIFDEAPKYEILISVHSLTLPKPQAQKYEPECNVRKQVVRPDRGDVFDSIEACREADRLVALCKAQNVRLPPASFAALGGYADHLPELRKLPKGYKLVATPQACEAATEWQNFCRRGK